MLFSATPLSGNCLIYSGVQYRDREKEAEFPGLNKEQRKAEIERHEKYTEDSFMNFITIENEEYVKYYTKDKPRMVFNEYLDGYELTEWYYDSNAPTIPSTYNEKRVLKIVYNFAYYNGGLTEINFEGTKAQWEEIEGAKLYNVTIHCTDGDIISD